MPALHMRSVVFQFHRNGAQTCQKMSAQTEQQGGLRCTWVKVSKSHESLWFIALGATVTKNPMKILAFISEYVQSEKE